MAAPENKDKEEKSEKPEPKPPARAGKLLPALLGLNSVLLLGVLAAVLLRPLPGAHRAHKAEAATAEPAEKAPEKPPEKPGEKPPEKHSEKSTANHDSSPPGPTMRLPDFVVHLRDSDADRYARMGFEIEITVETDKEKIQAHLARIRDGFLTYLSDRSVEELRGGEGISKLKRGLQQKLSELVPGVPIRALYITDLVVQ